MTKEDLQTIKVGDILTNKIPFNNPDPIHKQDGYDYEVIDINEEEVVIRPITSDSSVNIFHIKINEIHKCNNLRKKI